MNTKGIKDLKSKLKDSFVPGPFSKTNDPAFMEIIDMEHGLVNTLVVREHIMACEQKCILPRGVFREANQALIILQLEGQEALDNIDEILEVEGIDIIFIGPYDLSQSLGVPGEVSHPLVISRMEDIVVKSRNKGIITGTFVETPADAKKWIGSGLKYICYSVDVGIFYSACRQINDCLER
jgi:4-hydroxy-2-oxoheptanedioate aldolase